MVFGDVLPDVSNPKIILYDFRTFHINFKQNKHIKLDKTYQDKQDPFKANLSNVMDV